MTATPCPLCDKPASAAHRPFCGPACRDRDLLQWFGEGYRIPGPEIAPDGLDSTAEPD
ncbi:MULTISPECIES: DNA gyrase inhibitor YacG [unclassified Sphingomonas]|uniref:DNA gyrase inhibitor YacG n=1 Tax=unclassified Sphingomonas TaxID=196159 RepID=UPI001F58D318|nr:MULTISPECIES: DNA gyrase inhibitor YacG [unclassified Sphingomonas]